MRLEVSSGEWRPFSLGLNVLKNWAYPVINPYIHYNCRPEGSWRIHASTREIKLQEEQYLVPGQLKSWTELRFYFPVGAICSTILLQNSVLKTANKIYWIYSKDSFLRLHLRLCSRIVLAADKRQYICNFICVRNTPKQSPKHIFNSISHWLRHNFDVDGMGPFLTTYAKKRSYIWEKIYIKSK